MNLIYKKFLLMLGLTILICFSGYQVFSNELNNAITSVCKEKNNPCSKIQFKNLKNIRHFTTITEIKDENKEKCANFAKIYNKM